MSWKQSPIVKPIPGNLAAIASTAGGVASTLGSTLNAVGSLLSLVQPFVNNTVNPYQSMTQSLLSEVQNFNNDFFGTGVYMLTVTGYDRGGVVKYDTTGIPILTPGEAIEAAIASLDDIGDLARPQFSSGANIAAVGFLASSPSLGQLIALMEQMLAIFSIPDWKLMLSRVKRQGTTISSPPVPPDWKSLRLNSIDQLANMQNAVNDLVSHLKGYNVTADSNIADLVDIIQRKAQQLDQLANSLDQLASDLANTTGIFVLNLPAGVGGNPRLKDALRDCPLQRSKNQYTIMSVLVGGGPSLAPVDNIRRLVI